MTSTGSTDAYTVVINGTIKAQNYIFGYLGATGVTINSGATIDATYYLLDGTYKHPVNDNTLPVIAAILIYFPIDFMVVSFKITLLCYRRVYFFGFIHSRINLV